MVDIEDLYYIAIRALSKISKEEEGLSGEDLRKEAQKALNEIAEIKARYVVTEETKEKILEMIRQSFSKDCQIQEPEYDEGLQEWRFGVVIPKVKFEDVVRSTLNMYHDYVDKLVRSDISFEQREGIHLSYHIEE